ncbi:hypothetical protein M0D21_13370 [Aquimarina sp. D1M17]|uniref:hypothetical protein n=1 Tax=Aquimarina acroporae TaxID=2937283 RepID=UPI0020BD4C30|nr:hypothetical protein [Aquimarina acroporae]MCK8522568.1 hypothetical protein [Aquimarina acroporae]
MLTKILNVNGAQELKKNQQRFITGGRMPTVFEFCCGPRSQGWWIERYPEIAGDPFYNCSTVSC